MAIAIPPQILEIVAKEHFHPLLVHFPIGLWAIGSLLYILSLVGPLSWLRTPSIVMGLFGSGLGWLAVESGEMAEHIVGPNVCNLQLLADHAHQAETAQIFFAVSWGLATLFQILKSRFSNGGDTHLAIRALLAFGLLMGSTYLVLAGHKGFRLTYDEGAAVRGYVKHCSTSSGPAATTRSSDE